MERKEGGGWTLAVAANMAAAIFGESLRQILTWGGILDMDGTVSTSSARRAFRLPSVSRGRAGKQGVVSAKRTILIIAVTDVLLCKELTPLLEQALAEQHDAAAAVVM